ncbi:MAG TPA: hypothetical protein VFA26_22550 [Gemmataceae bacterium]|nr:hypothetical protein [Gemmataceae bacterium]
MIRFTCPVCNTVLPCPDAGAGAEVACLRCGRRLLLRPPAGPEEAAAPPRGGQTARAAGAGALMVRARCGRHGGEFAILVRKDAAGAWSPRRVFKRSEGHPGSGYAARALQGAFAIGGDYPGCPYCGNRALCHCARCGYSTCLGGAVKKGDGRLAITCGHCGRGGRTGGAIDRLDGSPEA